MSAQDYNVVLLPRKPESMDDAKTIRVFAHDEDGAAMAALASMPKKKDWIVDSVSPAKALEEGETPPISGPID